MPSGKVHARIGMVVGIVSTVVVGLVIQDTKATVGTAIGTLAGFLITPDIDHEKRTHEEQRFYNVFVPLGVAWQTLFYPYALCFKHRGISHAPVIGTLTRMIYIGIPLYFLAKHYNWHTAIPDITAAWFVIGWMIQDCGHILADWSL